MGRPITHSLVKALKGVHGFDLMGAEDVMSMVGASVNLRWREGSHVFKKGSPGEALYVVLSGEVRIYDDVDGEEVEIARTGVGHYFGEMSLLSETTHTKSVQAVEDIELLVIMREPFQEILDSNPELSANVHKTLESRRVETESKYQTDAADRL
ncbi:MAG TPA: cyclic nucleotide-binding domain-containing protein, partial [Actinomycetota bacterium]|nr:cyclic nucleotide-binding domain-containing protein [Actinomycetota bacterium]